jgi:tetratricopeptide (TPR) repeat protein
VGVTLREIEAYDGGDFDVAEGWALLALGRTLHARFLRTRVFDDRELPAFQRAAELFAAAGDARGEGEAEFWIGTYFQHTGDEAAAAHLDHALALARESGDALLLSCVERHLGFAAVIAGDLETAAVHLDESVRLRRPLDFPAGVAAALVARAELALDADQPELAAELLDEADALANDTVRAIVERVRAKAA